MFSEDVGAKINKHRSRLADILHCGAERSSIGDVSKEANEDLVGRKNVVKIGVLFQGVHRSQDCSISNSGWRKQKAEIRDAN